MKKKRLLGILLSLALMLGMMTALNMTAYAYDSPEVSVSQEGCGTVSVTAKGSNLE